MLESHESHETTVRAREQEGKRSKREMSNGQEPEGHGCVVMPAVVYIATEWTGRTREDQRVVVSMRFHSGADLCQRAINSILYLVSGPG